MRRTLTFILAGLIVAAVGCSSGKTAEEHRHRRHSDSSSNGARLVDTQGQQFGATYENTTAGPGFPGSVTLAPVDTGLGFITFAVPTNSTVAKVQFAMDSGFSGNTGQWNVTNE
ncbi:hypothetical protein [Streptomyces sp. SAS_270]|uniref:hypothetical protein n=1 Tax=Streptomyces sp. SAS_270 TaxID=3412748 RepID=UPI00403CBCF3